MKIILKNVIFVTNFRSITSRNATPSRIYLTYSFRTLIIAGEESKKTCEIMYTRDEQKIEFKMASSHVGGRLIFSLLYQISSSDRLRQPLSSFD